MANMPDWIREKLEQHVRTLPAVPPADRIFRAARDYHESAQRCFEFREAEGRSHFLPVQGLVLHAFACELYLKALFAIEKQTAPERGHELNVLFRRLDSATQEKITQRYHGRYEGGALSDDLVTFARVFQDWRYSYEFSGAHEIDQTGVAHLASALYETCAELRPDLVLLGKVHDRLVAAAQGVPIC
ncbi:hypothetical protein [Sandarakinorhabdus sp. AAP62]|uniref:hypothetical protein n=1 Tax=Sandarakinorhabdus sp. AAP62 TaxID=1248916 RepID=UPI001267286B|nr:hypothetical protein [Sandarakinorhabdus sp. AAP62]